MSVLRPPEALRHLPRWRMQLGSLGAPAVVEALGWEHYLDGAGEEDANAPGEVKQHCVGFTLCGGTTRAWPRTKQQVTQDKEAKGGRTMPSNGT